MAENTNRPGQPGEDNRARNPVTPEKAPQGGQAGNQSGNQPGGNAGGNSGSREDQGRGQTGKPGENLGSDRNRKGTDTATATPVNEEIGLAGDAGSSTDSKRAGSSGHDGGKHGGKSGNEAGNAPATTGAPAGGSSKR